MKNKIKWFLVREEIARLVDMAKSNPNDETIKKSLESLRKLEAKLWKQIT